MRRLKSKFDQYGIRMPPLTAGALMGLQISGVSAEGFSVKVLAGDERLHAVQVLFDAAMVELKRPRPHQSPRVHLLRQWTQCGGT